jgi:tripartite-type tricarboxylate transporter receptor subunit TctC
MTKNALSRRIFAALALSIPAWAAAQSYPNRTIEIIVPVSAGGPTDTVARVMAQRLTERLGQAVGVKNILGAGGVVGTEQAFRAKPDGYTLYMGVNSMAIYPTVRPPNNPRPFNVTDFTPIGGVADSAQVMVVSKASGLRSVSDLVALAKKSPDAVSYGSAGVGGTTHLPPALFAHQAGIKVLHVPYKGAAPALMDTIAGRVTLSAPGYSGALDDPIKSGQLIPIAVTSSKRLPFLPDVPTLAEQGYPDLVFPIWYALFGPKGLPSDVVQKLSTELQAMAQEAEYAKKLYLQGNVANYIAPAALGKVLVDDTRRLGERIRASGLSFAE